jgi:hypothetical protein
MYRVVVPTWSTQKLCIWSGKAKCYRAGDKMFLENISNEGSRTRGRTKNGDWITISRLESDTEIITDIMLPCVTAAVVISFCKKIFAF